MSDALEPPTVTVVDPGAHDLTDTSDDHFSDASEGRHSSSENSSATPAPTSPIPVTRVERVDDVPSHGEVPGTPAYQLRTQDAVPDEIEIVPDGQRSRSASRLSESDRPLSPAGMPIPKTVVEKVEPEEPSHGEVPGTAAYEKRMADAQPDEVLKSPIEASSPFTGMSSSTMASGHYLTPEGEPTQENRSRPDNGSDHESLPDHGVALEIAGAEHEEKEEEEPKTADAVTAVEEATPCLDDKLTVVASDDGGHESEDEGGDKQTNEDFDDDFDDFEEGFGEVGGDFEEFTVAEPIVAPLVSVDPLSNLSPLELVYHDSVQAKLAALDPFLHVLYPRLDTASLHDSEAQQRAKAEPLLSDRSASLWAQLVAPPPLQPPDWTRSRIRRLFLVSLGVPVDLDEILPASKQKKLVLPSTRSGAADGTRPSQTIKANSSSKANDSGSNERERERQGPPAPKFDSFAAKQLCSQTDAALQGYTDNELRAHMSSLESNCALANQALEYWTKRKESAVGDKEAFEGVIENLVGFMKKSKTKGKR